MYRRDLALTVASGTILLSVLARFDALDALVNLWAVAAGVGSALAVEAAFLAGTRVVEWWQKPGVAPAGALAVVGATAAAATRFGPVVVAATCWGLATYVALLAATLAVARGR